ncbi:MAG: hypothetical protein ABI347_09740 [Nitrososphaera sp.]|jgi:hypothetical protein
MVPRVRNIRFVAAVAASASFAAGALAVFFLFTDLPFYFVDGRQIEVTGNLVDCAPTKILDICYESGFRDSNGRYYYLITNLQQMADSNPDLLPPHQESYVGPVSNCRNLQLRPSGQLRSC